MPVAQALTQGLNAGTAFATLQQSRRRDAFDQQQKQVDNYNSIVGTLADTLEKTKEQTEIQLSQETDPKKRELILKGYKDFFDQTVSSASRAGQTASSRGIPVDPIVQTARLTPFQNPRDLTAEIALQATQKATAAGQVATAKVPAAVSQTRQEQAVTPSKGAKFFQADNGDMIEVREDGSQVNRGQLNKLPTTQNINEMTVGGGASQPEGQEPFDGIGMTIMDDIRQSSGAFAAASKAVSKTVGQAVEGTNPRLDSEQRVQNFNQEIKSAFTRNPRFPVAELERISNDLLPDPKAILTDPESEARKIPLLKQHLVDLNDVDSRALQGALSKKGRNDTIDRMATRQSVIDLIGDVPDISATTESRIEELEAIGIDNLTDAQLNELETLLP